MPSRQSSLRPRASELFASLSGCLCSLVGSKGTRHGSTWPTWDSRTLFCGEQGASVGKRAPPLRFVAGFHGTRRPSSERPRLQQETRVAQYHRFSQPVVGRCHGRIGWIPGHCQTFVDAQPAGTWVHTHVCCACSLFGFGKLHMHDCTSSLFRLRPRDESDKSTNSNFDGLSLNQQIL